MLSAFSRLPVRLLLLLPIFKGCVLSVKFLWVTLNLSTSSTFFSGENDSFLLFLSIFLVSGVFVLTLLHTEDEEKGLFP